MSVSIVFPPKFPNGDTTVASSRSGNLVFRKIGRDEVKRSLRWIAELRRFLFFLLSSLPGFPSGCSRLRVAAVEYFLLFRMPTPMKITGRSSSITNAFINSIIPVVLPSAEEVRLALETLGMTSATFQCAYCGGVASEWDHLRPLVKNKKPTGYISEIHNLVPCCGKCNQSKGNKEWKAWMLSTAKLSPTSRAVKDIPDRVKRLEAYESSKAPTKMDFAAIVGSEVWAQHQNNLERVQSLMRESQMLATKINTEVANAYKALSQVS